MSDDGLFSVHEEECLGVCELAPVVQVNVANHDRVTPERRRPRSSRPCGRARCPSPSAGRAIESFRAASRILAGLEPLPAEGASA